MSDLTLTPKTKVAVLTGAGVSAASGIPTFRGAGGLWRNYRATDLATPQAFAHDPRLVWEFYEWRRGLVAGCRPNPAHTTLVEMAAALPNFTLITQNVDGLHQAAGSQNVISLHGELYGIKCTRCDYHTHDRTHPLPQLPPACPQCGAHLRPDVVWFGESLDQQTLARARVAAENAAVFLVVGTSALVNPAAQLPLVAKSAGAIVLEFNLEPTPITAHADAAISGPAADTLPAWWASHKPV